MGGSSHTSKNKVSKEGSLGMIYITLEVTLNGGKNCSGNPPQKGILFVSMRVLELAGNLALDSIFCYGICTSIYHSYRIDGTGIFTYIWLRFRVNVGKYAIHGCYGNEQLNNHQNMYVHCTLHE